MASGYPDEGEVIHPDSVGNRVMPKRETYTHVAGDVVKGPWSLERADANRQLGNENLIQKPLRFNDSIKQWEDDLAKIIPMKKDFE